MTIVSIVIPRFTIVLPKFGWLTKFSYLIDPIWDCLSTSFLYLPQHAAYTVIHTPLHTYRPPYLPFSNCFSSFKLADLLIPSAMLACVCWLTPVPTVTLPIFLKTLTFGLIRSSLCFENQLAVRICALVGFCFRVFYQFIDSDSCCWFQICLETHLCIALIWIWFGYFLINQTLIRN